MTTAAVVLTHNRHELLAGCVAAISPQVEQVLVLDNCSDPPVKHEQLGAVNTIVVPYPDHPPNIGAMWSHAIELLEPLAARYVAFLCDDTAPPGSWFQCVVSALQATGAAAGSTHQIEPASATNVKHEPDNDVMGRMCGWAFVLDLQSVVRPDPAMHWWWVDTDIDFQARKAGGTVIATGQVVHNIHPNGYTVQRDYWPRIAEDGRVFEAKWGARPW